MGNLINELPDDLLIHIVSWLPVKEAATTSAVAKRWRNFWISSRVLWFDGSKMAPKSEDGDRISLELREKEKFIACVNTVLKLYPRRETISVFSITFDLYDPNHYHKHYRRDIDKWIAFALSNKIQHLNLNFNPNRKHVYPSGLKPYAFPKIGKGLSPAFASLVSLRLTRMSLSGEILGFLLSNCPFLQVLRLIQVCGLGSVCPKCPMIRLRCLTIIDCEDVTRLEICSPNLVSFEFTLWDTSHTSIVVNGASSSLVYAFGGSNPSTISKWLMGFSGCLSSLHTLTLETVHTPPQHVEEALQFPNLPRLRRLELQVGTSDTRNLLCLIPLIDCAPLLHTFKLVLGCMATGRQVELMRNQKKHECLKVFEMKGFSEQAVGLEMAIYVLDIADSLEKMSINGVFIAGDEVNLMKATVRNLMRGNKCTT